MGIARSRLSVTGGERKKKKRASEGKTRAPATPGNVWCNFFLVIHDSNLSGHCSRARYWEALFIKLEVKGMNYVCESNLIRLLLIFAGKYNFAVCRNIVLKGAKYRMAL